MANNRSFSWRKAMLWLLAVIYPLGVWAFECYSGFCADVFFDPMPSIGHIILVALVPMINGFSCWQLESLKPGNPQAAIRALKTKRLQAFAMGIAAYYSLWFLPLMPMGVVAISYFGLGFLPLTPAISLIFAIILYRRLSKLSTSEASGKPLLWGILVALLSLLVLDMPASINQLGVRWASRQENPQQAQRGVQLLQEWGNHKQLLRAAYNGQLPVTGPISLLLASQDKANANLMFSSRYSKTALQRLYYQVTGKAYQSQPLPFRAGQGRHFSDWRFDPDQGGALVGERINGLWLKDSRINGSISTKDTVAYLEWTLAFANESMRNREVRLQIKLPPEAVVSRASLWINGEERQAAYAGKAKARAAYSRVVRRSMDPLLVTTNGAGLVLVQAFPVTPKDKLQLRLGISIGLQPLADQQWRLDLPVINNRNFSIGEDLHHLLRLDTDRAPLRTNPSYNTVPLNDLQSLRLSAEINDRSLTQGEAQLLFPGPKPGAQRALTLQDGRRLLLELQPEIRLLSPLLMVIDGSASMASFRQQLHHSLQAIPPGRPVGIVFASSLDGAANPRLPIKPWDQAQRQAAQKLVAKQDFRGGQDNALALVQATEMLATFNGSKGAQSPTQIIWLTGTQPVTFDASESKLKQRLDPKNRANSPLAKLQLHYYSIQAGPNQLLDEPPLALLAKPISNSGRANTDLVPILNPQPLPRWQQFEPISDQDQRQPLMPLSDIASSSQHRIRLWIKQQVMDLIRADKRQQAQALAVAYRLITPVSGAVVLENQQQYEDNNLQPVAAHSVPSIPEPEQWLLLVIIALLLIWHRWRYPQRWSTLLPINER